MIILFLKGVQIADIKNKFPEINLLNKYLT